MTRITRKPTNPEGITPTDTAGEQADKKGISRRTLLGGTAAALLLAACAPTEKAPTPEIPTPSATASETPTPTETETTEPTPSANETENEFFVSFDEEYQKFREMSPETIATLFERGNFEKIAELLALEQLRASEYGGSAWATTIDVDPVGGRTAIYKSVDSMTPSELAFSTLFGTGAANNATLDGRLPEDHYDLPSTPRDIKRADAIVATWFDQWANNDSQKNNVYYIGELHTNAVRYHATKEGNIAKTDYDYVKTAREVGKGETEVNGAHLKYIDLDMENPVKNPDGTVAGPDRIVIRVLRLPLTQAFALDGGSSWDQWGVASGNMQVDEEGTPLTQDGEPIEMLLPWETMEIYNNEKK